MMEVVAGLVCKDGRFLICQKPEGKRFAGCWEFAGGKIEPGETAQQALKRELWEELRIDVRVGDALASVEYRSAELDIRLTLLKTEIVAGSHERTEHAALDWIAPEDRGKYTFCPADAALLAQLGARLGQIVGEDVAG